MIQDRSRKVQNVLDLVEQFSQLLLARGLAPFVRFDSWLPPWSEDSLGEDRSEVGTSESQ